MSKVNCAMVFVLFCSQKVVETFEGRIYIREGAWVLDSIFLQIGRKEKEEGE